MKSLVGRRVAVLALLAWMPAAVADAQYRAGIQGIVMDQSGARVPDAAVTIVNQETSLTRTTTTSNTGVHRVELLGPKRTEPLQDQRRVNREQLGRLHKRRLRQASVHAVLLMDRQDIVAFDHLRRNRDQDHVLHLVVECVGRDDQSRAPLR